MLAHSFDYQPTLRGATLTLRALSQSDLEGMCAAAGDPEIGLAPSKPGTNSPLN